MTDFSRERVWAEINLDDLVFNYHQFTSIANGKTLMPVVKADAYGHGAVMCAKTFMEEGARHLAVATAEEAFELRDAGITASIFVLGVVPAACVEELAFQDIELCVPCIETAQQYRAALSGKKNLSIHIKIDSGMNRLGFPGVKAVKDILSVISDPVFCLKGIFTHFAASYVPDKDPFTLSQYGIFQNTLAALESAGVKIPMIHCANSDGTVRFREFEGDMLRPGIFLYGYASPAQQLPPLKPALSVRSRIVQVKWLDPGDHVGYSCAWTAPCRTKIAVVPAGYADCFLRSGTMKLDMIIKGKRAPQIGLFCMDMSMIDVTDIPNAAVGDIVTIMGEDGNENIWADEIARQSGTNTYECLLLRKRIPRFYLKGDKVTGSQ